MRGLATCWRYKALLLNHTGPRHAFVEQVVSERDGWMIRRVIAEKPHKPKIVGKLDSRIDSLDLTDRITVPPEEVCQFLLRYPSTLPDYPDFLADLA